LPLRIAFDLDGVLADMDSVLVSHAETLFGEPMTRKTQEHAAEAGPARQSASKTDETTDDAVPPTATFDMTARQQRRLWHHVESIENFWETLPEIESGVTQRLAAIAKDRRWEVIFLTRRPETLGATAQVQSQRWLESKGFRLPSVFVVQGSRGSIAASLHLDIVVDDTPENCMDVIVDSKSRAILVWRDSERQLPTAARRLGIGVVKTVGECLDILTKVDSPDCDRPGMMARVMRLLGLKEPASASQPSPKP
jgi:hypothetical protein